MTNNSIIRLSKCALDENANIYIKQALDSTYLGMGKYVEEFEKKLKNYFGREIITVNSGTMALHLAIESLNLNKGDEIIAPSITYLSTFQAILSAGARPIACDVNLNGQISLESLKRMITKRTKAIIPVHYAGNSFDIDGLYRIANEYNLRVIEDAAHAFGSKYKDKLIGSFGDIICFSFDGIKNITCGEGGCILTNDEKLKTIIRAKRSLGVENDHKKRFQNQRTWNPSVSQKGWRAHMSNIHAAIGLSQLDIMENNFLIRKKLAKYYKKNLDELSKFLKVVDFSDNHVPHIFPLLLKLNKRDELRKFLLENNIESGIHYYPCHKLELFETKYELKDSDFYFERTISLPLHPTLKMEEVDFIISKLKLFFNL